MDRLANTTWVKPRAKTASAGSVSSKGAAMASASSVRSLSTISNGLNARQYACASALSRTLASSGSISGAAARGPLVRQTDHAWMACNRG